MKFVDEATIYVTAGRGGDGCVSFRREKFVPRGGPDGGDGGDGGSIHLMGKKELHTLIDLKIKPHYKAERGMHGQGKNRHGKTGKDVYIYVPTGTIVRDNGQTIGEVMQNGETLILARGGKGGRGNAHFASSTRQSPRHAEKGLEGEDRTLVLELKLISDIGLIGLPNAGKSTLLSALTNARPKIGDYPFTTLSPNLGVLKGRDRRIVIADMPGIIAGAHVGKGLGLTFLRHIERTRTIVFVIDIAVPDPLQHYQQLVDEFSHYSTNLVKKPRIVVFNKIDLLDTEQTYDLSEPTFYVSAVTGEGIDALAEYLRV
ncbi:GTPase ObgE [candidate division WOR-3 bacterium]|nr:GTPase ObgE [candidate division WOR-3 bacterium]